MSKVLSKGKNKVVFGCTACGAQASKWAGQCSDCQAWNTIIECTPRRSADRAGFSVTSQKVFSLGEIEASPIFRVPTELPELDRVLGGGLVPGSVILMGGDPGIGKSTLLLQTLGTLAKEHRVLYVTGEESVEQLGLRAKRLGVVPETQLRFYAQTDLGDILQVMEQEQPQIVVIDSIQTVFDTTVLGAAGAVNQVRECASMLARFAKQTNTTILLVGHVTKSGEVAGPRTLEHIVDAVIFMEGQEDNRYRLLRSYKNRFGAANEMGVFMMTEKGLRGVTNPSAIFLSQRDTPVPGSAVVGLWEGTRPLLIELQALVDDTHAPNPRRLSLGIDANRLGMLLAVLNKHGKYLTYQQDVFVNVVGGVKITETSADLACLMAVSSSLKNRAIASDWVIIGEVGLAGEIRPVPFCIERIKEASQHGFKRACVPKKNVPKKGIEGVDIVGVDTLPDALSLLF